MPYRLASLLLVLAMLVFARLSLAQPSRAPQGVSEKQRPSPSVVAEARRRFSRGNQLYRQGSYSEALLAYQAALDLYAEPVILYNLAQTYEKLRDPARAALFFERYLEARPKTSERQAVLERVARLRQEARVEVSVTSYPPGAAIYVDHRGAGVKGRTPFQLRLPLGKQRLILELAGFVPVTKAVEVRLGEANLVDAQLQRRSSIRVDADLPGATAYLEAKETGRGRGRDRGESHVLPHLFEVEPGRHEVVVEMAGYQPVRRPVHVEPGAQVSLLLNLSSLPRYGRLLVEGPRAGQVMLDGRGAATLPMRPLLLAAGSYRIAVQRDGHRTWESKITVEPNRLTVARVSLTSLRGPITKSVLYGSAGLSAATLIAGSLFGALALRAERDYNSLPERSKLDDGKGKALIADVCFGVAGAAALAAVVTYFATERGPSSAEVDLTGVGSWRGTAP